MDSSRLLFLVLVVITPCESSEDTEKPRCKDNKVEHFSLLEGEAFHFVPEPLPNPKLSDDEFRWYKNDSRMEPISRDKNESVHFHAYTLFFLNLRPENSGLYVARYKDASVCSNYYLMVEVFRDQMASALFYVEIKNSDVNKKVPCPRVVKYTCSTLKGGYSWMKDFKPLKGHSKPELWLFNTSKKDEGIYSCICTWTYDNKEYNSSGSRLLRLEEQVVHKPPEFISPAGKELYASKGFEIKLNCSVLCGTNVEPHCHASWRVNELPVSQTNGYNQTTKIVTEKPSNNTISTAVLTIEKVSDKDFQTTFKCIGEGFYRTRSKSLTLKPKDSIIPLAIGGVCVLLFCVFATLMVKCFVIDIVLFFRPFNPLRNQNKDKKVYDAYVVYQMQSVNKATEDTLRQFVTNTLPSVLEGQCGYRLFIHGRDDLPGEDCLGLVEDRIKQSRRLMVILSPGSGSGNEITDQHPASPQYSAVGGFDLQVGLHHVLVQWDMGVVLVQLGNTGPEGYSDLPLGLQHLIRISAPIRWPEDWRGAASRNSRFWKRVRYLMPATPAQKCKVSAII